MLKSKNKLCCCCGCHWRCFVAVVGVSWLLLSLWLFHCCNCCSCPLFFSLLKCCFVCCSCLFVCFLLANAKKHIWNPTATTPKSEEKKKEKEKKSFSSWSKKRQALTLTSPFRSSRAAMSWLSALRNPRCNLSISSFSRCFSSSWKLMLMDTEAVTPNPSPVTCVCSVCVCVYLSGEGVHMLACRYMYACTHVLVVCVCVCVFIWVGKGVHMLVCLCACVCRCDECAILKTVAVTLWSYGVLYKIYSSYYRSAVIWHPGRHYLSCSAISLQHSLHISHSAVPLK